MKCKCELHTIQHLPAWSASVNMSFIFTLILVKVILPTSSLIFLSLSFTLLTVALASEAAVFTDTISAAVSSEIQKKNYHMQIQ